MRCWTFTGVHVSRKAGYKGLCDVAVEEKDGVGLAM